MELKGRTAIVTGASRGCGVCIAGALAEQGVNLILTARNQERLDAVAAQLRKQGVEVSTVACDLQHRDEVVRLAESATALTGRVDILVNNAALAGVYPFERESLDIMEREIRVDLVAPILLSRLLLPAMLEHGSGHIVNVSSLGGRIAFACLETYAAAKAGLIAFTESLRAEFRDRGVSASTVLPGVVRGAGMAHDFGTKSSRQIPRSAGGCTPEQVGRAVVKAILKDRPEIQVTSPPIWPALGWLMTFPALREWLLRKSGTTAGFLEAAQINAARDGELTPH